MSGTLIKTEPNGVRTWLRRGPLANLREDLDELFSNVLAEAGDGWLTGKMVPSFDMSESGTSLEIRMDVPGMKAGDLDIKINGNALVVSGRRKDETEENNRTFHHVERRYGSFTRSIALPCAVNDAKVDAAYRDGVLTITLPKTEAAKTHKVTVKS